MDERIPGTEFEGLMPIDALLCALLEGSASVDQKQEFLDLVEADPRFLGQSELFLRLRGAIFGEELDLQVLQDFLGALSAEDGWDDFADTLRDQATHISKIPDLDLTDSIMAAVGSAAPLVPDTELVAPEDQQLLLISRLFDGDLSVQARIDLAPRLESDVQALAALNDYATIGRLVREAVSEHSRRTDLSGIWAGVAPAIGLSDPEAVPGWEPIGAALVAAVREHGHLEETQQLALAASIMEEVEVHAAHMAGARSAKSETGGWFKWVIPTFALAAGAAAMLFFAIIDDGVNSEFEEETINIEYAEVDEASLDELEYADDVFVHVMTPDDSDGPLIIMIDEDVPLVEMEDDGEWDTGMEPI
jgi:hypothetical protein